MNAPDKIFLPDIQSTPDTRQLAIQQVGVKGLRYPLTLRTPAGERATVAEFAMTVALPPEVKGTHMSRFVEILERPRQALAPADFIPLLADTLGHLQSAGGRIEARFPYFIEKRAPVSGVASLLDYDVAVAAEQLPGGLPRLTLEITAAATSLCPCSKKISDYGAHNQRSHLTLRAQLRPGQEDRLSIEGLVRLAEEEASCEVFGLLKRPDEKWVTERAYDNPKFVEDLVRDIALRLMAEPAVAAWTVASENFESIHNHSAYAELHGVNA